MVSELHANVRYFKGSEKPKGSHGLGATTLVACPRNHLYRTGHRVIERGSFCFVFNAEFDHFRDLAYDLHLQSIFRRANRNSLDQATEDLESLIPDLWLIKSVLQPLNPASVDLGQIRMKADRSCGHSCEVMLDPHPPRPELVQALLQARST